MAFLSDWSSPDPVAILLVTVTVVVFVIPIFILFPPIPVDSDDVLSQTHSKLGLEPSSVALPRRISPSANAPTTKPEIRSLWIYPVKSCKGIEVSRSKVLPTGLEHDRLYTLAILPESNAQGQKQESVWKFQTQRQLPLLANVTTDIWLPDTNKTSRALGRPKEGFVVLKFPWTDKGWRGALQRFTARLSRGWNAIPQKEIMLPIDYPSPEEQDRLGYQVEEVKVWKETVKALNMGKEIPPELALYLGVKGKLGLFRMDPELKQREVYRCAPSKETLGYQPIVGFQDAYPLHLLSLQSVAGLESMIKKDENLQYLDPRRFRANIIVSGSEAFAEDSWKKIKCVPRNEEDGDVCEFDVSCRTVRCKLPNVNPDDGVRHKEEPDYALRHLRDVDPGAKGMGCLGVQMVPVFPDASAARSVDELSLIISVGMALEVQETGEHVYIKQ